MELTSIQSVDRKVALRNPQNGEDLGLLFHLLSPEDDVVKRVEREWQNKHLAKGLKSKARVEEFEALQSKRILAQVVGWEFTDPELQFNGEQPEFSESALRKMMKDAPWVRSFLVEETEDVVAFFENSENN